ncbi:helix-turn-helix transcriptional regulator [Paenibacillus puldeungensis]|uniref:Helix-turn-helix transcriptional regulator n=1 Tax=Paenibacillus puldeungensis TaxID=696536 RepID=A0ABW3RVH5_9BACL
MKLERLISIIYKLLNHEVLSASMLAEEFQVSQRTIYRDIDVICAAGFPVVSYQGSNGGYGMMDGYKMDKSLLGSYDINSLITVLRSLSTVFDDKRAQGTIERLQTIEAEKRDVSLSVDLETYRTESDALRNIRMAIARQTIVRFDYINARNEHTTRYLEPVRLYFKYRNWYVYGFCRTRLDYRGFRLSRLMNLSLTQETFEPHQDIPEEGEALNKAVNEQPVDVLIRVNKEALAEALDQFNQVDKDFHDDGSMTMRIPVFRPLEAKWLWTILMGFGGGAEILEPLELRRVIKERLQKALQLYEDV